jgi:DnaJ-class molecular chaperone
MTDINIKIKCKHCLGTGLLNGVSCEKCGGDGWTETEKIDVTDLMVKLDYIHGKVTAIWNQVKPGGGP